MIDPADDRSSPEHPDDARKRLGELGVWPGDAQDMFLKERHARYYQMRKGGKERTLEQTVAANHAAWMLIFSEWPPPEDARPCESLAEYLSKEKVPQKPAAERKVPELSQEVIEYFDEIGDECNPYAEIVWVYQNIKNKNLDPLQCPSRGAWNLLAEARANTKWFYEKMYKPVAVDVAKQKAKNEMPVETDTEPSASEKKAVADIESLLRELKEQVA